MSHALHEISVYCLEELKFRYVLLGRFQMDSLEDRFGKYRQLSGAQYHILIRQIYESENRLRLQKVLDLPDLDVIAQPIPAVSVDSLHAQFSIAVTNADVAKKFSVIPAVTEPPMYIQLWWIQVTLICYMKEQFDQHAFGQLWRSLACKVDVSVERPGVAWLGAPAKYLKPSGDTEQFGQHSFAQVWPSAACFSFGDQLRAQAVSSGPRQG
ncbi:hypothetical protein HPB50_028013 [Hyalomma asiaticum]|nr:hypothetical protein HPB50_028013 [Hyalomma asiaticum]